MPFARRWLARGLDAVAIVVVLAALFHFFVQPRLGSGVAAAAPPVSLAELGGGRFSLESHRGRVVFLDFWASWCGPCKESLPLVERFARSHPDVDVIPVDVGENALIAGDFAAQYRLAHVVLDPDEIATHAFGVGGFPTMIVIDPAGAIVAHWIGVNPAIEEAMNDARVRYRRTVRGGATTGAQRTG